MGLILSLVPSFFLPCHPAARRSKFCLFICFSALHNGNDHFLRKLILNRLTVKDLTSKQVIAKQEFC